MTDIFLNENEMVTFIGTNKMIYDLAKKNWEYYATPSINRRLKVNNFKTALVYNFKKKLYILLVEKKLTNLNNTAKMKSKKL